MEDHLPLIAALLGIFALTAGKGAVVCWRDRVPVGMSVIFNGALLIFGGAIVVMGFIEPLSWLAGSAAIAITALCRGFESGTGLNRN